MKHFFRTIGGKTLVFIVCVLAACACAVCVFGIAIGAGYGLYNETEEALRSDMLYSMQVSQGDNILWQYLLGQDRADRGNITWAVCDTDGNELAHSENWNGNTLNWMVYTVLEDVQGNPTDVCYHYDVSSDYSRASYYQVRFGERDGLPVQDTYAMASNLLRSAYELRFAAFGIAAGALLLVLICFINLMCTAARRPRTEELCPGPLNAIPFDVLVGAVIVVFCGFLVIWDMFGFSSNLEELIYAAIMILCMGILGLGLCISAASRIKQHNLLKGTLCCKVLRICWRVGKACARVFAKACKGLGTLLKGIPLVPKTACILAALTIGNLLMFAWFYGYNGGVLFVFLLIEAILGCGGVLWFAINLRTLEKGGEALAGGNLSYQIPVRNMFPALRKHGENLNSIGVGMASAVEKQLKSERMKTELITNVSHDIKTPLTSIINYADLIGKEHSDNERINEYTEVLLRQSGRLKRLIEDLVEASKASTGNLEVELAPCDASVFLEQAEGEYAEKLQAAGLSLVTQVPKETLRIMADGRRMWRVFDNLMNNICKYAQNGTRVYLTMDRDRDNAVIIFRNTSRDQLNMTESELMERFTRGDSSRSTEGSGLGLNIARSMVELQGGSMRIYIDGDLFKVFLTFPLIHD